MSSGKTVYGVRTIAIYLSKLSRLNLLGNSALERALVDQWLECWQMNLSSSDGLHVKETLKVKEFGKFILNLGTSMNGIDPIIIDFSCHQGY